MNESPEGRARLQELYNKFDSAGPDGNARIAWYGQERALGLSHDEAVLATYKQYKGWCDELWPKRDIPLPEGDSACNS